MKPNGRRRWRKWLANQRRHGYEPAAIWGRDKQRVGIARRHQGQGWAGCDLPTADGLPALTRRPFTPRSFVGMTMGARKRAARRWLWPWMQRREALHDFREMITKAPGVKVEYHLSRRRYRIGERLRPCKWCAGPDAYETCRGKRIAQEVVGGHRRGECVFCRTCADAKLTLRTPNPDACDGSGVLPAKRSAEPLGVCL